MGVSFASLAFTLSRLWGWLRTPSAFAAVLDVPHMDGTSPDAIRIFFDQYFNKQPVVIEGVLQSWPAMQWSPSSLAERCPQARLPVYQYDLASTDWAALKDAGEPLLSEYLSQFGRAADNRSGELLYGLEMAMRNNCPELLEDIRIPAFFVDDMLVKHYKNVAWPTLIAGPRGTRSGLHRDTHDLPFWMALFVGKKRWRIFTPEDPGVEPYFRSDRNGFSFDAFTPDFSAFPELGKVKVYEHLLQAGQLLYIPSGAPHAAYNEEDTIAISGNYLDPRGLPRHLQGTCKQSLWADSKLCNYLVPDLEKERPTPLDALRERTFFEFRGHDGPQAWCDTFLPDLAERAQKHAEFQRCVPIVQAYCDSKKEEL